ncbi:MAG: ABC transporter permease [Anaerovorax sp.]|nr:ABC transporter permease [Anaerovorax sp.]
MNNYKKWLTAPGTLTLLVFAVAPLFIMLFYSFRNDSGAGFTLQNYVRFFEKSFYLKLTGRTVISSLTVTVISLLISYPLAYIMAKKLKGIRNIVLMLIIIPFFTNQLVRVYSWLIFLQDGGVLEEMLNVLGMAQDGLGILYTRTAVVISLVHIFFPYMVITIYIALERIDNALLEASKSLGASAVTTFFRVTLPMSWSGVVSGILLVFVPCLGCFVEPRILGGVDGMFIGNVIEDQFFEIYGWNFGAAIAFLLFAMVLVAMALIHRMGGEKQ